jgi:hypothetical protein
MKLSLPPKLVEKPVWVIVISFCKIFIPSYALDAVLCLNWPFLVPNRLTLWITLCVGWEPQTGLFWEFGLCTWFSPERGRLLILRRVLFRRVLTQSLEFCFDNKQLWFIWDERRGEDNSLHISVLEVPSFVKVEFLLRRRFPPHTVKELYLFFMVMSGHQCLFFMENFVLFRIKIKNNWEFFIPIVNVITIIFLWKLFRKIITSQIWPPTKIKWNKIKSSWALHKRQCATLSVYQLFSGKF